MSFPTDLKNEFSWSKARLDAFGECRRRYFYQYYDSWGGWDRLSDPRTRALYLLGKIQTRQLWMGTLVHEKIREIIAGLVEDRRAPDPEAFAESVIKFMRVQFKDSMEKKYLRDPKKYLRLFEHEHGVEVDPQDWIDFRDKARECVVNFLTSSWLEEFRSLSVTDVLELDPPRPLSFNVTGIRVWVKIDFAYRTPAGAFIWDWKTGKMSAAENSTQLSTYALYAHEKWKLDISKLTLREYYLSPNQTVDYAVSVDGAKKAVEFIRESAADMKSALADPDNNVPHEEEYYDKCQSQAPCRWCNFRKICQGLEPPEQILSFGKNYT